MRFRFFGVLMIFASVRPGAYEVTLIGGGRIDIPEAWFLDTGDPAVPSWYAPDRSAAAEILLWEASTWDDLSVFVDDFMPDGAEGDIVSFSCWGGEAALADWTFPTSSGRIRGWFLFVTGAGADVRISAIAGEEYYDERQPFLLSVLDSYIPAEDHRLRPGAVSTFLELSDDSPGVEVRSRFLSDMVIWIDDPAATRATQDVIEREALVLSTYATAPDLFYPAWERYYRIIYRDSYRKFDSLWTALSGGPLKPVLHDNREIASHLLQWLQSFSYGSTDGFSDLLAPTEACRTATGDCDSLALAYLILMDRLGIDGRLVLSQQARHALAALDLPGEGMRYVDGGESWLVAELTANLPLGVIPDRLEGVDDWYAVDLLPEP